MTDILIPDTSRFPSAAYYFYNPAEALTDSVKVRLVSKNKTQNIKIGQKKDVEISEAEKLWYRFNSQVKIIPKKLKFLIL